MFDIGFSEILLCAVVALLVVGPAKLPGALRTGSIWLNRFRKMVGDVKEGVGREIGTDDIRAGMQDQTLSEKLNAGRLKMRMLQQELQRIENDISLKKEIPDLRRAPAVRQHSDEI